MKYLNSRPADIVQESISSRNLVDHMVVNPDILPNVFQLYQGDTTPLSSILSQKGMKTKGLFDGMSTKSIRVVKSNHVQYAIKSSDRRKMFIKANAAGVTFTCDAYPDEPGKHQSLVKLYSNSNWAGFKEVIVLDDSRTHIYVLNEVPPIEEDGVYEYHVKLVTNVPEESIDVECLKENAEMTPVYTMHEHDWSETGVEKYTFDMWGHAFMTLQRVKYSYSGTAEAMVEGATWQIHNGQVTFMSKAQDAMMKRASFYHEYAIINGVGTVAVDGNVLMHDKQGREIMAGDGIINQNEGAYEYPYNAWSLQFLEGIMTDADIRSDKEGLLELGFFTSRRSLSAFSKMMRDNGFVTMNHNVEGTGAEKGVNNTYSYYELGNVRIRPMVYGWLDEPSRPNRWLDDGTKLGDWDGFFVPLGLTEGGEPQVQLVQLRAPKEGSVDGINVGGKMATSVDGSSVHMLFQTGVISRAKIMRIFRPYRSSSVSVAI